MKKAIKDYAIPAIPTIALLVLLICNISSKVFLSASLIQIVQMFIIIFVSYYLVQRKTDGRHQVELIDSFLNKTLDAFIFFDKQLKNYLEHQDTDSSQEVKTARQELLSTGRKVKTYLSYLDKVKLAKEQRELLKDLSNNWLEYYQIFDELTPHEKGNVELLSNMRRLYNLIEQKIDSLLCGVHFG